MESTGKSGIYCSTKLLILIGIATSLVFTGAILATYFGKSCTNCDKNLTNKCDDFYCSNVNILDGKIVLKLSYFYFYLKNESFYSLRMDQEMSDFTDFNYNYSTSNNHYDDATSSDKNFLSIY